VQVKSADVRPCMGLLADTLTMWEAPRVREALIWAPLLGVERVALDDIVESATRGRRLEGDSGWWGKERWAGRSAAGLYSLPGT
jgi:hypothetical protein